LSIPPDNKTDTGELSRLHRTYDLQPRLDLSHTTGLLYAMIEYNRGKIVRKVEGLTQASIDYTGEHNEHNSISQIIRHLCVVDLHWVYRLQGLSFPEDPILKLGPMYDEKGRLPHIKGISLSVLLSEYALVHEMLFEICKCINDDELHQTVPFENGHEATIRWGIWHIADHSRHHFANIVFMKKLYEREVLHRDHT